MPTAAQQELDRVIERYIENEYTLFSPYEFRYEPTQYRIYNCGANNCPNKGECPRYTKNYCTSENPNTCEDLSKKIYNIVDN